MPKKISKKHVLKSLKTSYTQFINWQIQGHIPEHPPRHITTECIIALARHIEKVRGEIPPEGLVLLKEIQEAGR